MIYVIELFALVIVLLGLALLVRPHAAINLVSENLDSWSLYLFAIAIRLVLGAALLSVAARSKFPLTLEIIGWLSILAAVALIAMGRGRMQRLVKWGLGFAASYARLGGLLSIVLGGFLIYAVM